MARIPSPNVAEVSMRFTQDAQQVENVFHVFRGVGWDSNGLNLLAGVFKGWWDDAMQALVSNTLTLREIVVQDLTAGGVSVLYTTGLPITGSKTTAAMPNSVTAAVKLGTGFSGRSFRGRSYILGLTEDNIVGNTLTSGAVTAFQDAYNELRTALDNIVVASEFCVLSQVTGGAPRTEGICTPIQGVALDPTIDNQRRRLPGRGR